MKKHSDKDRILQVGQKGGGGQAECDKSPAAELVENLIQLHKLQEVLLIKLRDQIGRMGS
jgi:Flp pilus assembly CpaE family ATPase